MKIIRMFLLFVIIVVITGCATRPPLQGMAVNSQTEAVMLKDEALLLMTVGVLNSFTSDAMIAIRSIVVVENGVPKTYYAFVEEQDQPDKGQEVKPRFVSGSQIFEGEYLTRYIRIKVKPGKITLRGINGVARTTVSFGRFFMPLHAELKVKSGDIVYLGRVKGTTREKGENDFRSGSMIPLIHQAATGMSNSTFDVDILDEYDRDMKLMKAAYPALREITVSKNILPALDREKAFKWWDEH